MSQPTCCAACTALIAASDALETFERNTRWLLRIERLTIVSGYCTAMVALMLTCFPGRAPISTTLRDTISYKSDIQVKVGGWQGRYAHSR